MFPSFLKYFTTFLFQALGQRLLCCPKRGTSVPPFLEVGEGGGWSRLPPRSVLNGAHRAPGPPAPLVDRRAPPYNPQLLKKLAKLLLVSTQLKRGPLASRPQPAPAPLSAVRDSSSPVTDRVLSRGVTRQALGPLRLRKSPYFRRAAPCPCWSPAGRSRPS